MADVITNAWLEGQALGHIDFSNDQIACALLYIPKPNKYDFVTVSSYAQVSGSELVTGNGYIRGGVNVTTSAYVDGSTQDIVYACSSPSWISSGGDIGPFNYAVFYDITANNTALYFYDFLKDYTANDGGAVVINIDPNGFVRGKRTCS